MSQTFEYQPSLSGDGLSLRPLYDSDFDALQACASELQTWADYPTPSMRETGNLSAWFPKGIHAAKALLILDETDAIIGTTRYYPVPGETNAIGIGYTFIAASARHQGKTNTELKRLMFDHAFTQVDTIRFHVLPENIRSQAAVKKQGGQSAGLQRLDLTDQPRDFVCFTLKKQDRKRGL